jgi:hypothetical protein
VRDSLSLIGYSRDHRTQLTTASELSPYSLGTAQSCRNTYEAVFIFAAHRTIQLFHMRQYSSVLSETRILP